MNDILADARGHALAQEILTQPGDTGVLLEWGLRRKLSAKTNKAPSKSMRSAPSAKPPRPTAPGGVSTAIAAPPAAPAPPPPATKISVGRLRAFWQGAKNIGGNGGFRGAFDHSLDASRANYFGRKLEKGLLKQRALAEKARHATKGTGDWARPELGRLQAQLGKADAQVGALQDSFKRHAGGAHAGRDFASSGAPQVDKAMMGRLQKFKDKGMDDAWFKSVGGGPADKVDELGNVVDEEKAGKGLAGWLAAQGKKDPTRLAMGAGAAGIGTGFALDRPSDKVDMNVYRAS